MSSQAPQSQKKSVSIKADPSKSGMNQAQSLRTQQQEADPMAHINSLPTR